MLVTTFKKELYGIMIFGMFLTLMTVLCLLFFLTKWRDNVKTTYLKIEKNEEPVICSDCICLPEHYPRMADQLNRFSLEPLMRTCSVP